MSIKLGYLKMPTDVCEFWALSGVDLWPNFIRPVGHRGPDKGHVPLRGDFQRRNSNPDFWSVLQADFAQCCAQGGVHFLKFQQQKIISCFSSN